jgi:hypothetical protein
MKIASQSSEMLCKLPQPPWIIWPPLSKNGNQWAPPSVIAQAQMMHDAIMTSSSSTVQAPFWKVQSLCRLATDEQMGRVWQELVQQCQMVGLNQSDIALTLSSFFREIVHARWRAVPTISISELEQKKRHYLAMAEQLRADYEGLGSDRILDVATPLISAASFYEGLATGAETARDDPLVVARQRTDQQTRGYALDVVELTNSFFRSTLRGTVAIICNVALGHNDMTGDRIKELARGGIRRQKQRR